ncbi:TlpA family protein disulfide reductase [Aestuariivivens sediminis]|uniref:TlpA family protein disulfide reductase n=1 Tax=Aestuariivivens sediminis TaxID=2913557 RepID=UPI001F58D47F|nr:hypothetical protein [Aestuariivivens sediminis]
MKLKIGLLSLFITLLGCNNTSHEEGNNYAYFGGQVINPKNNFVVISKREHVLDTLLLDGYNRFSYRIDSLETGFYTFRHGDEFQLVLLEPKDSIMFRLNTLDFDESLVFTGLGAKKNNYFVNEFLQNEIEEKKVFTHCQLDPKSYEDKINEVRHKKYQDLSIFKEKNTTSDLFYTIAKANIDYNYYFKKEIYPFVHYGSNKNDILNSLPEDFYAFRKSINYNDSFLKDHFTYQSFLRSNVSNLALKAHMDHSENKLFKRNSVCYTLDKLKFIDSLIDDPILKNNMLFHYTINFLTKNKDDKNYETVIASYLSKSNDIKNNKMVENYASAMNNLKKGGTLPDVMVKNYENKEYSINAMIHSPTVICFWSHTAYNHFKESHLKIKELESKYPEVTFVCINIDDYDLHTTKTTLKRNHISYENEYVLKNPKSARELLAIYPMTKTIILDKNKRIVNSNSNIFDRLFEEELLGAINR